jgi:hypothetical protein
MQKRKKDIINKSNQKENKNNSEIPYEYKVEERQFMIYFGLFIELDLVSESCQLWSVT